MKIFISAGLTLSLSGSLALADIQSTQVPTNCEKYLEDYLGKQFTVYGYKVLEAPNALTMPGAGEKISVIQ